MFREISLHLASRSSPKHLSSRFNPEESLTYEEGRSHRSSRITILEKKLSFKEQECGQLWIDLEEALKKVG